MRSPRAPGRAAFLLRLAGDVALGAGAALGQAPCGLWPVALAAFAAVLWRVAAAPSARAAAFRALAMGAGQILGAALGSRLAMRVGARVIKPLLVVTSTALALRLLWQML